MGGGADKRKEADLRLFLRAPNIDIVFWGYPNRLKTEWASPPFEWRCTSK